MSKLEAKNKVSIELSGTKVKTAVDRMREQETEFQQEVLGSIADSKLRNSGEMAKRQRSAAGLLQKTRNAQAMQMVASEQGILEDFLARSKGAQDRTAKAISQMAKAEGAKKTVTKSTSESSTR